MDREDHRQREHPQRGDDARERTCVIGVGGAMNGGERVVARRDAQPLQDRG